MNNDILDKIDSLISEKKIEEAQFNLSNLGQEFHQNPKYLYLRAKVFYLNKLYYLAIDTLLIALEFEKNDKIYNLISKIYNVLGNKELAKKISNSNLRFETINLLKDELTGIYRKSD
jgi:uncharacterized protein HemY|tara:strand:+ start:5166 stop:5516 length:351 start_codon:yes stop_codon:yes gene_type:complete